MKWDLCFTTNAVFKTGLAGGNSRVLVPDFSSFAFLSDFRCHGIKSIQLTLVQSLGMPPLLSQEHKPQRTMKAGNVQNSQRIRFAPGLGRMNSPTGKEVFFYFITAWKGFSSPLQVFDLWNTLMGSSHGLCSGISGSKVSLSFVRTSWGFWNLQTYEISL